MIPDMALSTRVHEIVRSAPPHRAGSDGRLGRWRAGGGRLPRWRARHARRRGRRPGWLDRELPIVARHRPAVGCRFPDLGDRGRRGGAGPRVRPAGGHVVLRRPEPVREGHPPGRRGPDHSGHRPARKPGEAVDLGADVIVAQGTEAGATVPGVGGRRCRSYRSWWTSRADVRSWRPVVSLTGGASRRPWPGRGRCPDRHPFPGNGRGSGRSRDRQGDRRRTRARTPSAAGFWTSPAARAGRRTTPPVPSGHPYLDRWRGREAELAGDAQARQDYQDDVATGARSLPFRSGRARRSTSSPTCPPPPTWSGFWPPRP